MRVKPNIKTSEHVVFIVKCKVSALMKRQTYDVYSRLQQSSGDVLLANYNCRAGNGGCCKHVAALLHTIVDYPNLELMYVPDDPACTQVSQQ